jgi:aryl-alcohol dehydrogenase-like predicted oxidoreductase
VLQQVPLGNTGLRVSRLCLGTGSSGMGSTSVQGRQSPEGYAELLFTAYRRGLNFWDTADNYGTHPHVRRALQSVPRDQVVIATKVYSATPAALNDDVARCLAELDTPWIDIMLMHEVDSPEDWSRKRLCVQALHAWKREGLLKAVGVSTHSIEVLEALVVDPLVEVVFTNYNKANEHMDAAREDYEKALRTAYAAGKGVYVHKTLNEGKLAHRYEEMLDWNLNQPFIHSVAMGITSPEELARLLEVYQLRRAPR